MCNSEEPVGSWGPRCPLGLRGKTAELFCVSHGAGFGTFSGSRVNFLLTPLVGF